MTVSRLGDGFGALAPPEGLERALGLQCDGDAGAAFPHADVQSAALGFNAPLDWPAFGVWLGMLLQARGPEVLRVKGLLDVGEAGPVAMNIRAARRSSARAPAGVAYWRAPFVPRFQHPRGRSRTHCRIA
jgi:G3E family GTPase